MREVEITSIHRMTPRVKQFELVADDEFDFEPGQHTQLHFEQNGDEVIRPYTATTRPGTDSITLAIKKYDEGTASVYMHEREPGDTIQIEDLDGNLYLRDLDSDVAFVSTGTGITPMIVMVKQYLREGTGEATLLYGEKTQEDVMFRETLDQLESAHENLTLVYSLSEEDWDGKTGHIQEHIEEVVSSPEETDFYVCGVPGDGREDEGETRGHRRSRRTDVQRRMGRRRSVGRVASRK